jgi:hypothetical protein
MGLVFVCVAAMQSSPRDTISASLLPLTISGKIQVAGIPTPQQMMRVVEGSPFTVPANMLFVVTGTAVDAWNTNSGHQTLFNGTVVLNSRIHNGVGTGALSVMPIPPGLVAPAGTSIDCAAGAGKGIVLGYLADA